MQSLASVGDVIAFGWHGRVDGDALEVPAQRACLDARRAGSGEKQIKLLAAAACASGGGLSAPAGRMLEELLAVKPGNHGPQTSARKPVHLTARTCA